jgi:prenyltransferase beta subunit
MRSALLSHHQNRVTGGFSKLPGQPVDIIHSFYSTAALSIASQEGTHRIHSAYCLRVDRLASRLGTGTSSVPSEQGAESETDTRETK